jgi:hypothetical protein
VADATAEITKKLRDYQNRIERLEKVEALSLSDELAHALGAGIAASAGVALDASRHDHIHEITASDNPGGKVSLLQTDASGHLTIVQLNTTANHTITTLTDHIGEHTGAHGVVVNNTLSLGNQSTAYMEQKIAGVNDEASTDASPSGALYGLFYIGCPNEVSACLCICDGIVSIISDRAALYSVTDTDGKHCLLVSAGKLTVKNRRGGALSYYITHIY